MTEAAEEGTADESPETMVCHIRVCFPRVHSHTLVINVQPQAMATRRAARNRGLEET